MSVTVDCGEGKCEVCCGWGTDSWMFPQNDRERFECSCPCHALAAPPSPEQEQQ